MPQDFDVGVTDSGRMAIGDWRVNVVDLLLGTVLDRLIHTAHKIQMQGESMRKMKDFLPITNDHGM